MNLFIVMFTNTVNRSYWEKWTCFYQMCKCLHVSKHWTQFIKLLLYSVSNSLNRSGSVQVLSAQVSPYANLLYDHIYWLLWSVIDAVGHSKQDCNIASCEITIWFHNLHQNLNFAVYQSCDWNVTVHTSEKCSLH